MATNRLNMEEYEKLKEEAVTWTSKSDNQFKILTCGDCDENDETENRIDFYVVDNSDISFYIVFSKNSSQNTWHLWSDKEDLLVHLNPAIESCSSCSKKSLTSLLDQVYHCLKKLLHSKTTAQKSNTADDDDSENEFQDCDNGDEGLDDDENDEDDGDYDDDGYYNDDDVDEEVTTILKTKDHSEDQNDEDDGEFFEGQGDPTAVARLVKDMKNMQRISGKYGIEAHPRGDNLFVWDVKLTDIPEDTVLGKDLKAYSEKYKREAVVNMEMQFPKDYPFSPPFIRVLRPKFQFLTGHVTIGGSVCLQMLTKSGWSPSNDIELILIQVRTEILSDKNARLDKSKENQEYTLDEAKQAFNRMVTRYGWNK
ncbi:ubiquitin-conjugating enzyme E2 Q1 [Patella vulgata]|uniref:ubiquitin-conjugating enzyme E2 Q1 n=1 Tax=Patella vulgata TaxID=6465 RepID=UPI00217F3214|nr:ubiquitin-conjugating enzyme E2 Q1 [Patella vulgata]XP_055955363.1 ubiquitin-conjugating enzyme E2 Q1 [Patella vulgata]